MLASALDLSWISNFFSAGPPSAFFISRKTSFYRLIVVSTIPHFATISENFYLSLLGMLPASAFFLVMSKNAFDLTLLLNSGSQSWSVLRNKFRSSSISSMKTSDVTLSAIDENCLSYSFIRSLTFSSISLIKPLFFSFNSMPSYSSCSTFLLKSARSLT